MGRKTSAALAYWLRCIAGRIDHHGAPRFTAASLLKYSDPGSPAVIAEYHPRPR